MYDLKGGGYPLSEYFVGFDLNLPPVLPGEFQSRFPNWNTTVFLHLNRWLIIPCHEFLVNSLNVRVDSFFDYNRYRVKETDVTTEAVF